ncbi:phage capsid protein [Mycobacteroides abscessus subsp. bolletii]|uniref:phage major capsid protein n=1 Tax=Mycobacteroides abscessus TaxID=36809 RepID=UPI0009A65D7D|nr:phage major capsid protein [Mycobacteroides abscessus]SKY31273.1 phage capsid protein [Mycobacteroides abscessus subsp. bolletii]
MALQHSTASDAWTPEDYGRLLDLAIESKSVAFKAATVVGTSLVKVNFPLWVTDPAVGWYNELDPISLTDGATGEVVVTPAKVAGMSRVSSELADDSNPDIANQIGKGLANQIAESVDKAWLANTTAKANDGLLSISYSTVDTGASVTNLDPFIEARFKANSVGAELSSWVMHPTTAETLTKLKKLSSGSNEALLQFVEDGIVIAGLPVHISPNVDASTVAWGIPKERVVTVRRKGTEVVRSRDSAFANDAVDIRGIARVGFGFLHEAAVVRLYDAA